MFIPAYIENIIPIFKNNNLKLSLVGGCIRDYHLGIEPHDYDCATDARPEEVIKLLEDAGYNVIPTGIKHGTVTALINGEEVEITTFRKDSNYSDGRRPDEVTFTKDYACDMLRRDFTINAMYYDLINKKYMGPDNCFYDLNHKIIRAVGNPDLRFKEDGLRILRALRFAIKYDFEIEPNTKRAMFDNINCLDNISKERITDELEKMLTCKMPITKQFKEYSDIIFKITPELKTCYNFEQNNKYHKHNVYEHMLNVVDNCETNDFSIKLAALFHDVGKPESYIEDEKGNGHFYGHPEISQRIFHETVRNDLVLSTKTFYECSHLILEHDRQIAPTSKSAKKLLNLYGEDFAKKLIILKRADIKDHLIPDKNNIPPSFEIDKFSDILNNVLANNNAFSLKDLEINGKDLINTFGLSEGKNIGIILNNVLMAVIDETVDNNKEALLNYVNNNFIEVETIDNSSYAFDNEYDCDEDCFELSY